MNVAAPKGMALDGGVGPASADSSHGQHPRPDWRRAALPAMPPVPRLVCRSILRLLGDQVLGVEGAEHVAPADDPFILVLNHSQKREAILIPAVLAALRGGRQIHFMADWNFLLNPLVGFIIRCNDPIIVNRKRARPRHLNVFRPWLARGGPAADQARDRLRAGKSVGIFPEGTVNRDPRRLLRGLTGAAQLSLEAGVPVVPAGVRFPGISPGSPIAEADRFAIHFGRPLVPRATNGTRDVRAWHARLMTAIAELSGKDWSPHNPRIRHDN